MTEQMQRCLNTWRATHPDGEPTLRQELAYRDGFADALKSLHGCSTAASTGDQLGRVESTGEVAQLELA